MEISKIDLENSIKEKTINDGEKIVLKPNWFLRSDDTRVILYNLDFDLANIDQHAKIHPMAAIVITFFNGKRTFKEVVNEVSQLTGLEFEIAKDKVYSILLQNTEAYKIIENEKEIREIDPTEFIISKDKVDLVTVRMNRPIGMVLHIADSCVRDCLYCNTQKRNTTKKDALTTAELFKLIDEAAELGVKAITIAGGDPFVRKDIPEIVEKILKCKIACFTSSKALITSDTAKKLKLAGLNYFQISIDAPNAEVNDFLVNSKNAFRDSVESIKNLKNEGITVKTNSIITPYNVDLVPQLIDLLASLGVVSMGITPYAASIHAGEWRDKLFLSIKQQAKLDKIVEEYRVKYPDIFIKGGAPLDYIYMTTKAREARFAGRANCSAGRSHFLIHEDGIMTLCEECPLEDELIIGNYKQTSLKNLWNSPKVQDIIYPNREKYLGTVCYDCNDYDACHKNLGRCWRESIKAYNKIWAPAPLCPKAPLGKRIF